ncbi:MAG: HlyD family efflux transporter periplasmic adaptor subunit [Verrucomicrobia bacterium]|nr:HlyD family efflux transporter periplasmic adaptor subunit [Verrucomicrobiota bacterium]
MAKSNSESTAASAPWEVRRNSSGKHRLRRLVPWLAVLIVLAFVGWGFWPKPVLVETAAVTRSALTVRVSEEGKTRIRNRYVVAAAVAGRMRRVPLKPGDEVRAGETLLTTIEPVAAPLLDPRSREQAEAEVSMREAASKQAAQSLEAARAALRLAEADRDRVRSVHRSGTVSGAERDRTEGDALIKAAEVRAIEFSMQVNDFRLAQARSALTRPDAGRASEVVELKSPVSGRVLKVMQESEMVVASGLPILEVGDPQDLEIEAEILSRDAVAITVGDSVEIEQWGGAAPLQGRVRRIESAAFTKISALGVEEQRVLVLCDLIDPPPAAKALGDRFRVEVRVAVWHREEVLVVPSGALFREGNVWKTFVFRRGRAVSTTVDAGHSDGRLTEVLAGLSAGTEVLLHPPDAVKDGSRVTRREGAVAGGPP